MATEATQKKPKKYLQEANSIYNLPTTEEAIKWIHIVCGYPVNLTSLKAIKAGNFTEWPILNERNVANLYPETKETPKGHTNETKKKCHINQAEGDANG